VNIAELDRGAIAKIYVKVEVIGQVARARSCHTRKLYRRNFLVADDMNRLEHKNQTLLKQVKLAFVLLKRASNRALATLTVNSHSEQLD
jgi:hypothetical protein